MTQYIDKSALIAEIRKIEHETNYEPFTDEVLGKRCVCRSLLSLLDTLKVKEVDEEPLSNDLEGAAMQYAKSKHKDTTLQQIVLWDFKAGAKWKKANLWKNAQGNDLPEIDREVIAITIKGKVVYAHRPNPDGFNCKSLETGKMEHFEPMLYDKGQWNQPDVKWWLDIVLPNLE